jgi:hypothetical protein
MLSAGSLAGGFSLDEPREQPLQGSKVRIELPTWMVAEAAGRLAHGESEYRRADQALDLGHPAMRDAGVAERPVDGVSGLPGWRGRAHPPQAARCLHARRMNQW